MESPVVLEGKSTYWERSVVRIARPLFLIFFIAFALRVFPNIWLEWREPGWHAGNINEIEFYYDDVARSLLVGKGFVHSVNPRSPDSPYHFVPGTPFHFVPPLYAWILWLEYLLFGPNVLLAKVVQALMDASVCLLLYRLGRLIADCKTALIAAFLYAVYPFAIYMSTRLYYQVPMNLALLWLILCLVAPINIKNGAWAGLATAVSALAKPVTLPFIILLPAIRFAETILEKKEWKPSLLWSVGFLAAFLLTLAPWTVRNYVVFNRFIPIQSGAGAPLIQGSKDEYLDLDVDSLREQYGKSFGLNSEEFGAVAIQNHLDHLKRAPLDYIRFLGKKFALSWYNTEGKEKNRLALIVQFPFLLFALGGLVRFFRRWFKSPNWYIPGFILYICAIQVVFFPLIRYTLAVMPLVMLIAAFGMNRFPEWNESKRWYADAGQ